MSHSIGKKRNVMIMIGLIVITFVLIMISIQVGAVDISWQDIGRAFTQYGDADLAYIIFHYRLPRIILAILVGSGLAVSGLVAQSILRNPLAAPDTLGISAGAALGAVCNVLLLPVDIQSTWLTSLTAFVGGALGAFCVYLLSYRNGVDPVRLALVGIAVSACGSTLVQLLITQSSANTNTVLLWLNGSLWGRNWEQVIQLAPIILIIVPIVWILAKSIDIFGLSEESSKGLGLRIEWMRAMLLLLTVILASGSVAVVGMVGFVGLVSPHIARRLVSGGHRYFVPVAALVGAIMMLLADVIGRVLAPPLEFPVGLVTSVIGAPYFLFLLWREYKSKNRTG
ncbi:ABC-type Fe3+-siderophore transport system permease subunit [Paenibacillus sp. SORGH_AS306]|uniref:FecCD family ABC transporter permease n=1 Tax=unclassified Paenibacillus TaxID=185978 RepID=UPI00277DDC95|nr:MULTISPECIES: iron ABC transporter permease [unclassified Paenibacillus]MDQ1232578.1 ABC-type Fe3+-siderophore transport system permease subunit [Paenibacillus sp. SORGH_AS_0306]MDR6109629.1 ABC-type Fe3+-siderophore transport system permease subunit [Paenibacillus sp. SORGH_AS_0338]